MDLNFQKSLHFLYGMEYFGIPCRNLRREAWRDPAVDIYHWFRRRSPTMYVLQRLFRLTFSDGFHTPTAELLIGIRVDNIATQISKLSIRFLLFKGITSILFYKVIVLKIYGKVYDFL